MPPLRIEQERSFFSLANTYDINLHQVLVFGAISKKRGININYKFNKSIFTCHTGEVLAAPTRRSHLCGGFQVTFDINLAAQWYILLFLHILYYSFHLSR